MRRLGSSIGWVMALTSGPAAAVPPAVRVQVSAHAGLVGQPVAVTFWVAGPAGAAPRWHLADAALAKTPAVAVLDAETPAGAGFWHRVVFTAIRHGQVHLGPFPVLKPGPAGATDTIYAPAITVKFWPESASASLHPLRANRPAWQSADFAWPWLTAGLVLLSAGAASGRWWWQQRRAAPAPAAAAAQAYQLALHKIAALEHAVQTNTYSTTHLPDQVFSILHDYFGRGPADASPVAAPLAHSPTAAERALAEAAQLTRARFAPSALATGQATELLHQAQRLLAAGLHDSGASHQ